MANYSKDVLVFVDGEDFQNRTPKQALLFDIISTVNQKILTFYRTTKSDSCNIIPIEMLVLASANMFASIAQNILSPLDTKIKLEYFNSITDELTSLSKEIFMIIEANNNADENKMN